MNHLPDYYQYLLAGKIAGNLSAEESAELNALLEHDTNVQAAYQELINRLPQEMITTQFRFAEEELNWEEITEKQTPVINRSKEIFIKLAIAASLIGITFSIWWYYSSKPETEVSIAEVKKPDVIQLTLANGKVIDLSSNQGKIKEENTILESDSTTLHYTVSGNHSSEMNTVFVPAARSYQIILNDGSKVWMNSLSKLSFPFQFDANKREISIEGEAYIEVAKDAKRPFFVKLPGGVIQVLGTEFNVNTYDSGIVKVALVQGSVKLNSNNESLNITPGKEASYGLNGNIGEESFNPKFVLSWRKGLMYFEYTDLKSISEVISRWYGVKVQISNPALQEKKIKCILEKDEPLSTFLKDLKYIAKIESTLDSQGEVLYFK